MSTALGAVCKAAQQAAVAGDALRVRLGRTWRQGLRAAKRSRNQDTVERAEMELIRGGWMRAE